jgi:hypothetical protein
MSDPVGPILTMDVWNGLLSTGYQGAMDNSVIIFQSRVDF